MNNMMGIAIDYSDAENPELIYGESQGASTGFEIKQQIKDKSFPADQEVYVICEYDSAMKEMTVSWWNDTDSDSVVFTDVEGPNVNALHK